MKKLIFLGILASFCMFLVAATHEASVSNNAETAPPYPLIIVS